MLNNITITSEIYPYVLVAYACLHQLQKHPDFAWTKQYKLTDNEINQSRLLAAKSHQGPLFKFGVQVPQNKSHADHLDTIANNNLWKEAHFKEVDSLKKFKTFRALEPHEPLPEGYSLIPYHIIYDVKFEGEKVRYHQTLSPLSWVKGEDWCRTCAR